MEQEILEKILTQLNKLDSKVDKFELNVNDKFSSLKSKMNNRFNNLEKKVDAVYERVGQLTEFEVQTNQRLTAVEGGKK